MLWIDIKYANLIGNQMDRFKLKSTYPYVANFRCPYCGDSTKHKGKARGYLFQKKTNINFKCHNCGKGCSIGTVLKQFNTSLYDSYRLERFRNGGDMGNVPKHHSKAPEYKFEAPTFKTSLLDSLFDRLDKLPDDNLAVKYAKSRKLPDEAYKKLYYVDNVKNIENLSEKYRNKIQTTEPRLVIPFYNRSGKFTGVSCRELTGLVERFKYLTIPINSEERMIYNLDSVDFKKDILVVEGPIDSLFLPNSIAMGTSDLKNSVRYVPKSRAILVFDNQPRNPEIVSLVREAIKLNHRVVIWPARINEKDINDMVLAGENPLDVISESVHSGLKAELQFNSWRKV